MYPYLWHSVLNLCFDSPSQQVLSETTHQFSVSNIRLGCLQFLFQKFYLYIKLSWLPNNLRCNRSLIDVDGTYYTSSYIGTTNLLSIQFMRIIISFTCFLIHTDKWFIISVKFAVTLLQDFAQYRITYCRPLQEILAFAKYFRNFSRISTLFWVVFAINQF